MQHLAKVIFALVVFLPSNSYSSETKETERLRRVTEQYGRCADATQGGFGTDKEIQDAAGLFLKAMVKNIRSMNEIELSQGNEGIIPFINLLGKDIATGYLLKAIADGGNAYQQEKRSLAETNNWDWKRTYKQLWSKYGCDAIYKGLSKSGLGLLE